MNKIIRKPQCFACSEELEGQTPILYDKPEEVSSDNVCIKIDSFHICDRCFKIVLDFMMGIESPRYTKGMPVIHDQFPNTFEKNNE